MFLFAYLLFSNVATVAGLLFAVVAQSRRRDDELPGNRFDPRHRLASASLSRAGRMAHSTHPR